MSDINNNLDILDKDNLKAEWPGDGIVYSGDTKFINAHTRKEEYVSPDLAAAILGLNNTASPTHATSKHENMWTDIDAQEIFLNEKPTCYLIFGKPGLDAYSLGEALSKKYNCIHLCPTSIINDEILQNSLTGKCLDFHMRHNYLCTYRTIIKMLQQKLTSPAVKHRGYVISGIPIVTASEKPATLVESKYGEKAVFNADDILLDIIVNMKKKKSKKPPTETSQSSLNNMDEEEDVEEEVVAEEAEENDEEEVIAELPKFLLNTCDGVFFTANPFLEIEQAKLLQQIQELFNLNIQPDFIIYITCPDADVLTKKQHKYINYKNSQRTVHPFPTKVNSDLRWPSLYTLSDYENPHDMHVFNPKYNCRPPLNFAEKCVVQLCNYRDYISQYIENKILDYDPKQVIKLDGRTSTYQMIHQIKERLLLMNINPVIIPEPLYIEEPPEDLREFWEMVKESQTIQSGGVLNFRRYPSPWFNRCPVELKKRKSVQGMPKFAVKFCKHIYLLSSLDNFILFCRNPRPFLKMKYLEPTCRIIVIGTKSSGKTMVAECLSWLFDCSILNFQSLLEIEREKKRQMYNKNIFSEIIATVEETRFIRWENQEQERKDKLNQWIKSMNIHLKSYIKLLKKTIKPNLNSTKSIGKGQKEDEEDLEIQEDVKEVKDESEKEVKEEGENVERKSKKRKKEDKIEEMEEDPEILNILHALKEPLSFLPIDFDDVEGCEALLENQVLQEYAPSELKTVTMKPTVPVLGDVDIREAISDYIAGNDLLKELEPTTEELMTEIIKYIYNIDSHHKHETNSKESYGKYIIDGLPSESEYWAFLEEDKLLPDYTIALIENRELEPEIIVNYLNTEKCLKNYYETISSVKDPFILSKLQTKQFPNTTSTNIRILLNDLIDSCINSADSPEIEENPEIMTTFAESIEKFKMDWDSLKIKLEETSKCFIEIELENKTDNEVLEQMLLKLRQCYYLTGEPNEDYVVEDENEDVTPKDLLNHNNSQNLCETNIYCPITYYNHGSLWPGKNEFSLKYDNKIHYFAKEEFLDQFQTDVTKYQAYNKPFKILPKLKICITGCIGSGASSLSKLIARELGLLHIDFVKFINDYYLPRHYKKVGRMYENPFLDTLLDEEGVVEFQMDEENPNLLTDILSNEVELRRIFYNYFERSQPILPLITHSIIEKLWHEEPYVKTGFVLDGYPRLPQDIEDLMQCNCIPDMVIELENDAESCIERLAPAMLKKWQSQLKQAKEVHLKEMQKEKSKWMDFITKKIVIRMIIDEILVNVIEALPKIEEEAKDGEEPKIGEEPKDDEERTHSAQSFAFDVDEKGVDSKLYIAYNEIIEQQPPPEDTREWENVEDEHEKIVSRLEIIHETDSENMEALKEVIEESRINFLTINSSIPIYKLFRVTLSKLSTLRNRTQSFFEETFIISSDIAEILLSQGYCFLSKFGRLCPVYVYENPETTFNPFKMNRRKGKIFPIIHRAYIYYVGGEDYVNKFRSDPLRYISSDALKSYHPYPLRIGVIGTPKVGKSSLAASISKHNQLLCISRGQALRSILENMYWTELGSKISKKLDEGETVDSDLIMSAVQTVAIDHRTVTNGFVLDGFPDTPYEAMILAKNGLYPNIIFDVSANKEIILGRSQNEIYHNIIKYKPPYSHPFVESRFSRWSDQNYKIRQWINGDYQNSFSIHGNESKWQCLQVANNTIKEVHAKIYYYLANVETKIVPANALAISNEMFNQKQTTFKNMCPACIRKNVFRHNGYPTDKTGVVQFQNKFFWICAEHMDLVIAYPNFYLSKEIEIPEIPAVVKTINTSNIYENGICIVTYAEQLPKQKLERGTNQFAASYKGKTYLFCRESCLQKFLDKPHLYAEITVFKGSNWFPRLSLKKLPNLGYLEQTLANILTEACCSVNAVRPKYPGLSFQVSASIYIAIYLKSKNTRLPKEQHEFYKKHLKSFEARSKLILDLGLRMRSMENPFADYPKCNHKTPKYYSSLSSMQGDVRRVPVPDERFDYLCEYHKPASKVPAFLNVVDIAGLVRGAAEGQGLGNAFLSHIKACDAIFNLCRAFDDEDVIHVDGDVNPVRDLETIGEELRLKDEEELMKNIEKLDRVVNRGNDKKLKPEYDTLQKIKTVLVDEKKHIRFGDWSAADIEILNKYLFLTSKPALYLVNLSEKDYIRKKNKWLPKLKEWIDKNDPGAPLIPFSGAYEMKLVEMDAAERQAYLKENNLSSALDKIIVQGYKALQLEYFFTAGPDEVKAWTILKGTKAPQAAGRIHTDFEKGFIMAEVMHYKDFKEEGTEAACKSAGKYRQQGRNYVVEDGDIIFFKFNAGAGLKDAKKK